MDFDKALKDFSKDSLNFSSFQKLQKDLGTLARLSAKTIPKVAVQRKELRRKERLKELVLEYFQVLGLTADPAEVTRSPYVSTETQIKTLIQHQDSFLTEVRQVEYGSQEFQLKKFASLNYSLFKNPLVFQIKAILEPESKLFRPETNNCTVKSIFFHNEIVAFSHQQKIAQELELKLLGFTNKGQINRKINRMIKIDSEYRKSNEKTKDFMKKLNLLVQKPFFSQVSQIHLSQEPTRHHRSLKSQNPSEDSQEASTSRSSSQTNRRLGFFPNHHL